MFFLDHKVTNINEKKHVKEKRKRSNDTLSMCVQSTDDEKLQNINKRKTDLSSSSAEGHSKEYPCDKCVQSLASRLRYHTIPKLELRDTIWIPTDKNKNFFIICYTELGPQSDGILDELRRAEIGIRDGTKVFIVPLSCALGIQKVVNKQKTLNSEEKEVGDDGELGSQNDIASPSMNHQLSHMFLKSIRARLTVQKIIVSVQSQSSLTFDYILFCILASMISGLGLLENSTV
jgi:hypothetical protein